MAASQRGGWFTGRAGEGFTDLDGFVVVTGGDVLEIVVDRLTDGRWVETPTHCVVVFIFEKVEVDQGSAVCGIDSRRVDGLQSRVGDGLDRLDELQGGAPIQAGEAKPSKLVEPRETPEPPADRACHGTSRYLQARGVFAVKVDGWARRQEDEFSQRVGLGSSVSSGTCLLELARHAVFSYSVA